MPTQFTQGQLTSIHQNLLECGESFLGSEECHQINTRINSLNSVLVVPELLRLRRVHLELAHYEAWQ
jgi:hypothetical protein